MIDMIRIKFMVRIMIMDCDYGQNNDYLNDFIISIR